MKTILMSFIFITFFPYLISNPLIPALISEIYFENDEWTIELYDILNFGYENLDNCWITSSSGSSYFNSDINFSPNEPILITELDLQFPLYINRNGDEITIQGDELADGVEFGNFGNVNPPYDGQSLVRVSFSDMMGGTS